MINLAVETVTTTGTEASYNTVECFLVNLFTILCAKPRWWRSGRGTVDGFYASTQGREVSRFEDLTLFDEYIKPFDLALMEEINRSCIFNVLHVCDYHDGYDDLTPFLE